MPEFLANLWLRLRALAMRRQLERDLDDELAFHLEMRREKLERSGLSPEDARNRARRRLGNPVLVRETSRSLWTFAWLESFARDIRYAARTMAAAPVFTAVAIATLAFGIGANTAIFSIVDGILLRELPYEKPSDLYVIHEAISAGSRRETLPMVKAGNLLEWQRDAHSFEAISALLPFDIAMTIGSETVNLQGLSVSAGLFPALGIRPRVGRSFTPEEDLMGHGMQIILTDRMWRERFRADPEVIGRKVSLLGWPATIIGILPASFYFPRQDQIFTGGRASRWNSRVECFMNLNLGSWEQHAGLSEYNYAAMGRVRAGIGREGARAELEAIENGISRQAGAGVTLHAELAPLQTALVGPVEKRIWMLMAGAAAVMAIVCVNLAGLMLGRNSARTREVAIRLALGAGRGTVLRQFAAEGLLLAAIGGSLGVAAAYAGVRLLVRYSPIALPRLETVSMDGRVLLFSAAIAVAAGLLFSLVPALRMRDRDIEDSLKSATPGMSASRRNVFLHDFLAGSEIALCTVLLICALLLGESLSRVLRDNAWLNENRVFAIEIDAPSKLYQEAGARRDLYRNLLRDARDLPGVTSVGLVNNLPLHGEMWNQNVDFAEAPRRPLDQIVPNIRLISPGYDDSVGLGLVAGRRLADSDYGRDVALVSESVARLYPERSMVGMHMQWPQPGSGKMLSLEVAGVVRDVRADAEKKPILAVYIPYWIWPPWNPSLVVRVTGPDPAGVAAGVERMIRRTHGEVPIMRVETLRDVLDTAVASRRFLTRLGVVFAASATFLAALGVYGVVALATARRRREIAIRIAVGASHSGIFGMVIGKAAKLALLSAAIGLAAGIAAERAMVSLLYEVRPVEPLIYAAACAMVIAVGLVASVVPALRAARVNPVVALKYE